MKKKKKGESNFGVERDFGKEINNRQTHGQTIPLLDASKNRRLPGSFVAGGR